VTVRIGTSGWSYDHWDGVLYPPGIPARPAGPLRPPVRHGRAERELLPAAAPRDERDDARLEFVLGQLPPWMRVAVEFRHPSWHTEEVFALLERYGAAYCVMSGARLPCVLRATAPIVYVRMHGPDPEHLYAGSYSDADLAWWACRVGEWAGAGQDVFVYFNNDGGTRSGTPSGCAP
jgi:uncharacterized protein YecE (DUF72 family)